MSPIDSSLGNNQALPSPLATASALLLAYDCGLSLVTLHLEMVGLES